MSAAKHQARPGYGHPLMCATAFFFNLINPLLAGLNAAGESHILLGTRRLAPTAPAGFRGKLFVQGP